MTQGDEPALNEVFRVHRYAPDHPAFAGRDLTPGDPIELPSTPVRLSALAARPLPDRAAVEVTWSTAVEVRHEGFHVERGPTPGGPWELRTSSLIRGRSPYRWVDEAVPTGTPWYYRVVAIDTDGRAEPHGPVAVTVPARPMVTRLRGVRPNPAPGRTAVSFVLARAGPVELAVYDVRGRLVRHLARGPLPAGEHSVDWNGDTEHGARAPAGIYFVRLTSTGTADVRSIVRTDPD